jgi:hypothetical protein
LGSRKPEEKHVKTKTLDEIADSEVLAMALEDVEFLGLIKWKPDADKKPTINENPQAHVQQAVGSN